MGILVHWQPVAVMVLSWHLRSYWEVWTRCWPMGVISSGISARMSQYFWDYGLEGQSCQLTISRAV